MSESESEQISQAKSRQFKFLIGEYESNVKQVKMENERLEKELIGCKIKEEYNRAQIQ